MPVYLIARNRLADDSEQTLQGMQEYVDAYLEVARDHPHTHLVQGSVAQVLEGPPIDGALYIQQFASKQEALDYYYSEEYQRAIAIRDRHSSTDMVLVEGLSG